MTAAANKCLLLFASMTSVFPVRSPVTSTLSSVYVISDVAVERLHPVTAVREPPWPGSSTTVVVMATVVLDRRQSRPYINVPLPGNLWRNIQQSSVNALTVARWKLGASGTAWKIPGRVPSSILTACFSFLWNYSTRHHLQQSQTEWRHFGPKEERSPFETSLCGILGIFTRCLYCVIVFNFIISMYLLRTFPPMLHCICMYVDVMVCVNLLSKSIEINMT